MRLLTAASAAMLATMVSATPVKAQQGGTFMWCMAWADNGTEKEYFYSAFFAAGAWEAERKALKFKSEVEADEISASEVTATCMGPEEYEKAIASRNAAMKAGPGKVLAWQG